MFCMLVFLLLVFAAAYVWVKKKEAELNDEEWSLTKTVSNKISTLRKWFRNNLRNSSE